MTHEQILAIMELTEQEKVAKIIELEMRLKTEVKDGKQSPNRVCPSAVASYRGA